MTAPVRIRLQKHDRETAAAFEPPIQTLDSILDCYMMTGSDDYLLRVLAASLKDYESFVRTRLHPIAGIASINTSFAYGLEHFRAKRVPLRVQKMREIKSL